MLEKYRSNKRDNNENKFIMYKLNSIKYYINKQGFLSLIWSFSLQFSKMELEIKISTNSAISGPN